MSDGKKRKERSGRPLQPEDILPHPDKPPTPQDSKRRRRTVAQTNLQKKRSALAALLRKQDVQIRSRQEQVQLLDGQLQNVKAQLDDNQRKLTNQRMLIASYSDLVGTLKDQVDQYLTEMQATFNAANAIADIEHILEPYQIDVAYDSVTTSLFEDLKRLYFTGDESSEIGAKWRNTISVIREFMKKYSADPTVWPIVKRSIMYTIEDFFGIQISSPTIALGLSENSLKSWTNLLAEESRLATSYFERLLKGESEEELALRLRALISDGDLGRLWQEFKKSQPKGKSILQS